MKRYWTIFLILISCSRVSEYREQNADSIGSQFPKVIDGKVEDTIGGVPVTIIKDFKEENLKSILVLPGWAFNRDRWLKETNLRKEAAARHYILVLPEMNRSVYASVYYPETSPSARLEKSGPWLTDTFVEAVGRKYGILLSDQLNFVMGLSTGGRGAVYCLWKAPAIFKAGAALSGDFDQSLYTEERIMTEVYGDFELFPERWKKDDNLRNYASMIYRPIYLAHGEADRVIPMEQTALFYAEISHTNKNVKLNIVPAAGHDFQFWGGEVKNVLQFFDDIHLLEHEGH